MDRNGAIRLLIVYDVPGWAYWRRAEALRKYAPKDFDVEVAAVAELANLSGRKYDVVFNLEYTAPGIARRMFNSSISVVSYNVDRNRNTERWGPVVSESDWVVCNNRDIWLWGGKRARTCNISNGVDLGIWSCEDPEAQRRPRWLWCGSTSEKKRKNYHSVIVPLQSLSRQMWPFEYSVYPVDNAERFRSTTVQAQWYQSGFAFVSPASAEGTPNTILESMAAGCVPVATNTGNIPELVVDGVNGVVIEPSAESAMDGIRRAWSDAASMRRESLRTIKSWDWSVRSLYFFALFRRLVRCGVDSVKPFTWMETTPDEIEAS